MTAASALRRAIWTNFENFRGVVVVEALASRSWASVTFTGERHEMRLRLEGDGATAAAEAFLDGLADREFDLHRHILIDIACDERLQRADGVTLVLAALTVEAD